MIEDAIRAYAETGFACLPAVLGEADLAMLRREWARLWAEIGSNHPSIQWRGHAIEGQTADRIDPAYPLSDELRALCGDERLTRIADAALGRTALLFKDKLISKGVGTHGYGLHQDWAYWTRFGAPADHLVTLQIAIDPADAENGAVEVWPKAPDLLPPPAEDPRDVDPGALGDARGELMALDAGDVLLLHPLCPHRSAANRSDRPRRSYFITYVSAEYEEAARRREAEVLAL